MENLNLTLVYSGKTKDVYRQTDGNYLLKFKDDVTGADGVFDPGSNSVGLTIDGAGRAGLQLTKMFFEILRDRKIPTHYIAANVDDATMTVKPAAVFGKGLEVVCRYRAVGSFHKRYGAYVEEGAKLDALVEVTLKDDARQDPPISADALDMLGILSKDEYAALVDLTRKIGAIIKEELAKRELELYDIKFEFGRVQPDGAIVLIDEISGGNMRAYKDGAYVDPLTLTKTVVG